MNGSLTSEGETARPQAGASFSLLRFNIDFRVNSAADVVVLDAASPKLTAQSTVILLVAANK